MYTRQTISKAIEALTWGFPDALLTIAPEDVVDFLGDGERDRRGEARRVV
jgi:hypothetical protein